MESASNACYPELKRSIDEQLSMLGKFRLDKILQLSHTKNDEFMIFLCIQKQHSLLKKTSIENTA